MSRFAAAGRAIGVGISALGTVAYWAGFRPRSQVFGSFPYAIETEEKVVALTFDDGPNEPYTSRLLDTLDAYQVKATFFRSGVAHNAFRPPLDALSRAAMCWAITATATPSPAISSSHGKRWRSSAPRRSSTPSPG
jgi:peptidoglycan/xylan/chitin deacetylase (PgdA/CDA1 family)